ncbi:hypothetical protein QFZ71_000082 [Streptomyces sp. V2I9]|nr:hypothetical protein [Streptomyces sp. V2I9]
MFTPTVGKTTTTAPKVRGARRGGAFGDEAA